MVTNEALLHLAVSQLALFSVMFEALETPEAFKGSSEGIQLL